jgi:hypothetical protein
MRRDQQIGVMKIWPYVFSRPFAPLSIERLKPTLAQVVEPVPTTPTRLAPGPMESIFERENPPEFQS